MTHRADVARGRDVVARWCDLAEQRLEYLTELFETGRWRRYHSERAFLENIQEAKTAVEIWRDLSTREASRDNLALDMSWLSRTRATRAMLPRGDISRDDVRRFWPQPAQIPAEPPRDVSVVAHAAHFGAPDSDTPAIDPASDPVMHDASELTLDMTALAERYPLLRNAF
jgi:uncharacterized repeat protein (TIGR03809 family)